MQAVTGVFRSREDARRAAADLVRGGIPEERINLLYPGASEQQVHSLPVSQTEQPGLGAAIGSVVGAALGLAGGMELGAAVASAAIPGVGTVIAVGIAGAALLGAGGAAAGSAMEQKTTEGLPEDEIFFYEDALRQGRSLVIAMANDKDEAGRTRTLLAQDGAESLDAAREAWWIGLRDSEAEHYQALGRNFEQDQKAYRAGFEAALRRETRAQAIAECNDYMKRQFPGICESEGFRKGFERGQNYLKRTRAT